MLRRLHHDIIVRVVHDEWHGDQVAIIMKKLQGADLRQALKAWIPRTVSRKWDLMRQMVTPVVYLHDIAYLDVNPESFVFADVDQAVLKLVDFGLAIQLPPKCHPFPWNSRVCGPGNGRFEAINSTHFQKEVGFPRRRTFGLWA